MARGKKTSVEDIYKVMVCYCADNNCDSIARQLDIPVSTVRDIIKKNKDNPEFVELRRKKREEYASKAGEVAEMALNAIRKRLENPSDIPLNHLSTTYGILKDKEAMAAGTATQRVEIVTPKELKDFGR